MSGILLAPESHARRDFDVVTKLEVPNESYSDAERFHGERFEKLYSGHPTPFNTMS